ncbi:NUMOD1 domain-containing DNA-binding protein [Heyndrickxia sporothermodurans]|uniref:NUMOD1 domain-containing DNA-binding protein n=1 Tax=Heyndrickxia sporothermodurans TaxID=46224 RepID=UPI002E227DC1|nr:NUMOD1 domain-containing DNA-binding protein [Heyndrickxia sporothermodurans]MED3697963.1 NUMOD1 domain-containing DNA-binding protein [Heyndrickxia sporothermodurans]
MAEQDPYLDTLNKLADNIIKRTISAIDRPKNRVYKERGIQCKIGNSRSEVREVLNKHYGEDIKRLMKKGLKPSVDRIDPFGHYELGNIQIIPLRENLSRIKNPRSVALKVTYPNGNTIVFDSISDASKYLNCKRDTIYHGIENPGINRKGLKFQIL